MTALPPSYNQRSLIAGLFTPTWNLYHHHSSWISSSMDYRIGPQKEQPSFLINSRGSWKAKVVLTRPSTSEPLAKIRSTKLMTSQATASVPSTKYTGELRNEWSLFGTKPYSFTVPIPARDGDVHLETFEWRPSKGNEVRNIDKKGSGFKLVRLDRKLSASNGKPHSRHSSGITSDYEEIVAVYARNSSSKGKELGTFSFLGCGLTNELGTTWAIMAVASMCYIVDAEGRMKAGAEGGAAVGGAVGAAAGGGC